MVWSSRCSVNFAALATLVSFSTVILRSKQMCHVVNLKMCLILSCTVQLAVTRLATETAMQLSLLDALRHNEALITVGRIRHGARRTVSSPPYNCTRSATRLCAHDFAAHCTLHSCSHCVQPCSSWPMLALASQTRQLDLPTEDHRASGRCRRGKRCLPPQLL
jgi:hypothetical protein